MRFRITMIMSVIVILLAIVNAVVYNAEDSTVPVISITTDPVTYVEGDDQSVLLTGVTARDTKDGDITDKIRIYDISIMSSGDKALVTYAVYDSNNNLGKSSRVVDYLTAEGAKVVKAEEDAKTTEEATTEEVTTEAIPEGYEDPVMKSTGSPVLKLSTHEVEIEEGDYFDPSEYIETAVDDVDEEYYLITYTYVDGYYNTYKKGEYELTYYCIDSDENVSNFAKLKLLVK